MQLEKRFEREHQRYPYTKIPFTLILFGHKTNRDDPSPQRLLLVVSVERLVSSHDVY